MTQEFIQITQLISDNTQHDNVYQVQPRSNHVIIMHVGNMPKLYDININTIDLDTNLKCHIINKMYNTQLLNEQLLTSKPLVQIITILICLSNNGPRASLSFNFTPKTLPKQFISSKDNIINIPGQYSISLYLNNNKTVCLETLNNFEDNEAIMLKLCGYLFDENIINLILNDI